MSTDSARTDVSGSHQRPWRPAAAVTASAALHVAGALVLATPPESWAAVLGTVAVNQALLFGASLAPRNQLLGPNMTGLSPVAARRGEVAITFDDGPDPDITGRVLDALDRAGARASFFCIGARAAAHPDIVCEIVRRGHAVENHSQHHSTAFGWYGPQRLLRDIASAQDTLTRLAGRAPEFFRAPMGVRNPFLDWVLARLNLRYVSWTRRGYDTVDGDARRVLGRLAGKLAAGDVIVLHDGVAMGVRLERPPVLDVLPRLLEQAADRGLKPVALGVAC